MNWVDIIKNSIPDHSKDIGMYLDTFINHSSLDEVDAHACALAAALSASNGALAYLIQSSETLINKPECDAAKTAASLMGMTNVYYPFVEMTEDLQLDGLVPEMNMLAYANTAGVSKKKFEMYALCASIVNRCEFSVRSHYSSLKQEGMPVPELQSIGKIAAVISAIGKVAPPG